MNTELRLEMLEALSKALSVYIRNPLVVQRVAAHCLAEVAPLLGEKDQEQELEVIQSFDQIVVELHDIQRRVDGLLASRQVRPEQPEQSKGEPASSDWTDWPQPLSEEVQKFILAVVENPPAQCEEGLRELRRSVKKNAWRVKEEPPIPTAGKPTYRDGNGVEVTLGDHVIFNNGAHLLVGVVAALSYGLLDGLSSGKVSVATQSGMYPVEYSQTWKVNPDPGLFTRPCDNLG